MSLLVVGLAGAPVEAAPAMHVVHEGATSSAELPDWPCPSLGFDVLVTDDFRATINVVERGREKLPYFHFGYHGSITYAANDHAYTNVFAVNDKDQKITVEGSELVIDVLRAGRSDLYLDGEPVFRDPGAIGFQFRMLHNGTLSNPDDDVFVEDSFHVTTPSTGFDDGSTRTFCEDLADFLAAD